jgi:pimeloyl-ACP methyl ester carboxylesterase
VGTSQRIDIGERSLYINCTGEGSPTVVLEGGVSTDWQAIQTAVEGETRVCSYDRPDSPQTHSDPTSSRTAQQVVDDLSALLEAAGEAGPYVLVGHSLGGIYVQLFAYQHPEDVAGLVLLDPTPENFEAGLVDLLRTLGTPVPDQTGALTIDQMSYAQLQEARREGELPQVPMILISHGIAPTEQERPPGWPVEEEEALFQRLHEEIVELVPGSQRLIASESKHDIHTDQPDLVVEAITQVVAAARDPSIWATP